jgi:anti-sigma B factor antagonist
VRDFGLAKRNFGREGFDLTSEGTPPRGAKGMCRDSTEDGMDFSVDHTTTDDGIVSVALTGALDVATAPQVRTLLVGLIDEGHHRLVLEMSGLDFVDSIGLGVFVGVVHRLRPYDSSLAVAAPSPQARKVFEITQLSRVLPLYDNAEAAFEAVRTGEARVAERG